MSLIDLPEPTPARPDFQGVYQTQINADLTHRDQTCFMKNHERIENYGKIGGRQTIIGDLVHPRFPAQLKMASGPDGEPNHSLCADRPPDFFRRGSSEGTSRSKNDGAGLSLIKPALSRNSERTIQREGPRGNIYGSQVSRKLDVSMTQKGLPFSGEPSRVVAVL